MLYVNGQLTGQAANREGLKEAIKKTEILRLKGVGGVGERDNKDTLGREDSH